MLSDLEILKGARELLDDPQHWTRLHSARDSQGGYCGPLSPLATCWCLLGALRKCGTEEGNFQITSVVRDCAIEIIRAKGSENEYTLRGLGDDPTGDDPIVALNDEFGTHEDVLAALDCAIAKVEE